MFQALKGFNNFADKLVRNIVIITFSSMTLLVFAQIIFRYVLKASLSWSEELARYLFLWLTFIGSTIPIRESNHIKVTMFVDMIKNENTRKIALFLSDVLSLVFLILLVRYAFPITSRILQLKQISPSMPFLKIGIVYFAVPVGGILMVTNLLENIVESFKDMIPSFSQKSGVKM
jgi:TRAP-type C4-dicarboxylate transport system permease small subunit